MITKIWDLLFVRRRWEIIQKLEVVRKRKGSEAVAGYVYVLKDQYGNIKRKAVYP